MAKMYEMKAPRAKNDGSTYWHRVGTAWESEKGIQLVFDSLPLPDADGRCAVNLYEPRERDGGPRTKGSYADRAPPQDDLDDSVPF